MAPENLLYGFSPANSCPGALPCEGCNGGAGSGRQCRSVPVLGAAHRESLFLTRIGSIRGAGAGRSGASWNAIAMS